MTKHTTDVGLVRPLGGSEEVASAFVERAAFDSAYTELERWKEAYELLLGAFELRLAINECLGVMADLGGLVYDTAIGALADQAQEARARAEALARERHDLANEVMREREIRHFATNLVNQLTVLRHPDDSALWRMGGQPLERDYQALKRLLDMKEG